MLQIIELNKLAKKNHLQTLGSLNLKFDEMQKTGVKSIVLLGPDEPKFWKYFSSSPEKNDNAPHPLDRWTKRVLEAIATNLNAKAFFPFSGPPYWPFFDWALKSGESFRSPVNFLVHERVGLFVSFRGAIGFQHEVDHVSRREKVSPCDNCEKPCIIACPVNALTIANYNDLKCRAFVTKSVDEDCPSGCLVRRSCPVGNGLRETEQSKFHMSYFMGNAS